MDTQIQTAWPVGHSFQMEVVTPVVIFQPKGQAGSVWPLLADSRERGPVPFHLSEFILSLRLLCACDRSGRPHLSLGLRCSLKGIVAVEISRANKAVCSVGCLFVSL